MFTRVLVAQAGPPAAKGGKAVCNGATSFRSVPEMLYSGTLSWQQVDDLYTYLAHGNNAEGKGDSAGRPMTLACTGYNNKQTT